MVNITGVSKTYGGKANKAVDNLNLTIEDGEITGFIGPNGAGKTTTLKMLTGILNPDEGSININGYDVESSPIDAKMQFGFVPDSPDMFLRLKGIEYLNFMGDVYNVSTETRKKQIDLLASRFEIRDALNDRILSYSHGMRQKIVIMGALLHKPSVWILDEPLTGLDPNSAFELKEMMKEHVKDGNSVIFSTHVLEVAEKLCDKVAIINKGRLVYLVTLDQLKSNYLEADTLEDIFLKITRNV
jgi:ABC-2 type transport system ATP-binding protein